MSAYFVQRAVIDQTVNAYDATFPKERTMADLGRLGRAFWRMNAEAMRQRYPQLVDDPENAEMIADCNAYTYTFPEASCVELIEGARCLIYQCHEGDIPETRKLYAALKRLTDKLGHPEDWKE